jgi:hypothetical protein
MVIRSIGQSPCERLVSKCGRHGATAARTRPFSNPVAHALAALIDIRCRRYVSSLISRTEAAVRVRTLQDCAATPRSGHAGPESRLALVAASNTRGVALLSCEDTMVCQSRAYCRVRRAPQDAGGEPSCVKTTSSESRRRIAIASRVSGVCRSATIGHDPRAPPVEHAHVRRTRFRRPWLVASYIRTTSGSIYQ